MKRMFLFVLGLLFSGNLMAGGDLHLRGYSDSDSVGIKTDRYRGGFLSLGAVQSGDQLFYLDGYAYDGSSLVGPRIAIRFEAAETWDTTSNGTSISINATPIGSTTMSEIVTISPIGLFSVLSSTEAFQFGEASLNTSSSPSAAGILAVDSGYDLYISSGTGPGAWIKVGGQ